jgi:hypothetical protein
MSSTRTQLTAWVGGLILLALHLDFWRERSTALLGGAVPFELAWRVGWMLAAFIYLVWFCRAIWIEEE